LHAGRSLAPAIGAGLSRKQSFTTLPVLATAH
jgi:hypothetical protein